MTSASNSRKNAGYRKRRRKNANDDYQLSYALDILRGLSVLNRAN